MLLALPFIFSLLIIGEIDARKHHLELIDDDRHSFPISTFGFYRNGHLQVDMFKFRISGQQDDDLFGFSLEKTSNPYSDNHPEKCLLRHFQRDDSLVQHVFFIFDLANNVIFLNCSNDMKDLHIYNDTRQLVEIQKHIGVSRMSDTVLFNPNQRKRSLVPPVAVSVMMPGTDLFTRDKRDVKVGETLVTEQSTIPQQMPVGGLESGKCNDVMIHMTPLKDGYYNFSFIVYVSNEREEGLYTLNFHNCKNYHNSKMSRVNLTLRVEECNPDDNYLSAGEMPLPALYLMMSVLFFLSACFWFFLLKKSRDPVFKIHYLMGLLVVIKSLSLLFHGINYHFIQTEGVHMEAWAVMYYITHLMKGALLFTVLALIGSGWAFIKHVLSSREKKIFMVVIPLQIIANVATIIVEETEEASQEHALWVELLFLIDFFCCGAILLPVVWSIKHLQESSQTDGKAQVSLLKLKLFRHFYIMIVCYIYFTRIIVYLLRITVPFQYEWLDDMFREMATYVFFVLTGYKFRPANNNPYFVVALDEEEMDQVLTTTGLTESVTRLHATHATPPPTMVEVDVRQCDDDDDDNDDNDRMMLLTKRETSFAYD